MRGEQRVSHPASSLWSAGTVVREELEGMARAMKAPSDRSWFQSESGGRNLKRSDLCSTVHPS